MGRMIRCDPPVRPHASLVWSPHPLLADAGRVIRYERPEPGETLAAFLERLSVDTSGAVVVAVDERIVAREQWQRITPQADTLISVRAAVAGGGDSNVLAVVALIAVAVAAPYIAGAAYGAATSGTALTMAQAGVWAAGTTTGAIATAAVTVAGSMLVNKLFAPPKPSLGRGLSSAAASPTYSISGGQNRARAYEPIALTLGTHRLFFDLAGRPYATYEGEDQYLYQIFCLGLVGPFGAMQVTDLRIGDTPIGNYSDVTVAESVGSLPALWPANVDTTAGGEVTTAAGAITRTSSTDTIRLEVDITAVAFHVGNSGYESRSLSFRVEYRPAAGGSWTTLIDTSISSSTPTPVRKTYGASVASGQYEVRVTKLSSDVTSDRDSNALGFAALKSYQADDGYYEGQQFLAIKVKASGQINGVIDQLNAIVKTPTAAGVYSSNPADLFVHFATGHADTGGRPLWGAQLAAGALDAAAIDAWRSFCTTKGLTCNLVIDSQRSVWDVLEAIARCGRASPSWHSGKLATVWDADGQPVVATYSMGNIRRGTFGVEYQAEETVEEVVLHYIDAANDYESDTVRALAPGVTSPSKSATIELWGCTNQAMAVKECYLALAENLYRTRLVSWETDMEGLVVTRGDVVSLSHDLTQWGTSGRLVAGTTTTLTLDREITLDPGGTWIGVTDPEGTQYILRVNATGGPTDTLTLIDPLPVAPDSDTPVDWRYCADYLATPGKLLKIVAVTPAGLDQVKIQAVDEYDAYYASESGTYTPPTRRDWTSHAPQIRSLAITENPVRSGDSAANKVIITWAEAGNVASRRVRYSLDGGAFVTAGFADGSRFELVVGDVGTILVDVTLYDAAGGTSSAAQASLSHTLAGVAWAPLALDSFSATGEAFQIRLSWGFPESIDDLKHVELRTSATNDFGTATLLSTIAAPTAGYVHTGLGTAKTRYYWARTVDVKNRTSAWLSDSATTITDPSDLVALLTESAVYADPPIYPFVSGTLNGTTAVGLRGDLIIDGTIAAVAIDTDDLQLVGLDGSGIRMTPSGLSFTSSGGSHIDITSGGLGIYGSAGTGDPLLLSGTGVVADWDAITNRPDSDITNVGPNLIENPNLFGDLSDNTTAPGWTRTVEGVPASALRYVTSASNTPPWDAAQPVFYANADSVDDQVRWVTGLIPFDRSKAYTGSVMCKRYSGTCSALINLTYWTSASAYISEAALLSVPSDAPTTYELYSATLAANAAPSNAAFVRFDWYGVNQVVGATMATAFAFNEGEHPTKAVTLPSRGPITAANISTYIDALAVNTAQIGNAAITEVKIGTAAITNAKIGTAAVKTLQLDGEAVTVPVSGSGTSSATTPSGAFAGGSVVLNAVGSASIFNSSESTVTATLTMVVYENTGGGNVSIGAATVTNQLGASQTVALNVPWAGRRTSVGTAYYHATLNYSGSVTITALGTKR